MSMRLALADPPYLGRAALVDAFYRAAEEVRTQHPETPDQPQRKETRW